MSVVFRKNEDISADEWIGMGNLPMTVWDHAGARIVWQGHGASYIIDPTTKALTITRQYIIDESHGFAHTVVALPDGTFGQVTTDGIGYDLDRIHEAEAAQELQQAEAAERQAQAEREAALVSGLPVGPNGNRAQRRGTPSR